MQSYQLTPQRATCPVCFSTSARLLWSVNSNQAAQHFVLKEKDPKRFFELVSHIETLWGQTTCEVVRCNTCEFCFSNPYVGGDKQFYDLAYDRSGYPRWNWEHQRTYEVLRRLASPNLRLLEVGAGDGSFIRRIAPEILPKEEILCTEFSEYGRRRIQEFGVECLSVDVRNLSRLELLGEFDIVCMFQVLEHMDGLDAVFGTLRSLMKERANLFISVPNPRWIQFIELNGALLDMPPNHVGRWNRRCFAVMAEKTGFQIESYEIEQLNFLRMLKQFGKYRFLRNSQESRSLANRVTRIRERRLRLTLQAIGATAELIKSFPIIFGVDKRMGMSQWVHLKKAA
jgi:2-polyprenyl-3-methyl-5-hydroxy-6-metoxy-1,4-benzoquinol methylase